MFECSVNVSNASLKDATARLVIESNSGMNLLFKGEIKNGTCRIPIKKLKGLLESTDTGKVRLEMIVEDMYFCPWESDFKVETHTDVKVSVTESVSVKPTVNVQVKPVISEEHLVEIEDDYVITKEQVLVELHDILQTKRISRHNIGTKLREVKGIINEYFEMYPEASSYRKEIINKVIREL
jgi:hypothetical protein